MNRVIGVDEHGNFIFQDENGTQGTVITMSNNACSECSSFFPDESKMTFLQRRKYQTTGDIKHCNSDSIYSGICGHYVMYAATARTHQCNGEEFTPRTKDKPQ